MREEIRSESEKNSKLLQDAIAAMQAQTAAIQANMEMMRAQTVSEMQGAVATLRGEVQGAIAGLQDKVWRKKGHLREEGLLRLQQQQRRGRRFALLGAPFIRTDCDQFQGCQEVKEGGAPQDDAKKEESRGRGLRPSARQS